MGVGGRVGCESGMAGHVRSKRSGVESGVAVGAERGRSESRVASHVV